MKKFIFLSALTTLLLSNTDCSVKKERAVKYKGKLEIAAICMNYTISVKEGTMNASDIVANWTDETTTKSYNNVFKLGNPCDFPASIKQGDEFYFTIDTAKGKDCAVCMAYYPTPQKAISIKVVQ
ncbi:MAG: hypothetical protein SGI96_15585 [Bacteroidota bacterium]|nr:hypothetical protein [Bacteroidota bacterium]